MSEVVVPVFCLIFIERIVSKELGCAKDVICNFQFNSQGNQTIDTSIWKNSRHCLIFNENNVHQNDLFLKLIVIALGSDCTHFWNKHQTVVENQFSEASILACELTPYKKFEHSGKVTSVPHLRIWFDSCKHFLKSVIKIILTKMSPPSLVVRVQWTPQDVVINFGKGIVCYYFVSKR